MFLVNILSDDTTSDQTVLNIAVIDPSSFVDNATSINSWNKAHTVARDLILKLSIEVSLSKVLFFHSYCPISFYQTLFTTKFVITPNHCIKNLPTLISVWNCL